MAKYNHFTDAKLTSFVKLIKNKVKPMIPTKVSQLDNDSKYLTTHQSLADYVKTDDARLSDSRNAKDVQAWAKAETKPSYTASEVGACVKNEVTVTIAASAWSNSQAVVSVSGVTKENAVVVSPISDSYETYAKSMVRPYSQAQNSVTFACKKAPSSALTVNVLVLT